MADVLVITAIVVCVVGLQALGHEVWTAETGHDGLSEAAIRGPEVIVLDLGLPDMDGLEVCKRIRTWTDVPIVVLSADSSCRATHPSAAGLPPRGREALRMAGA